MWLHYGVGVEVEMMGDGQSGWVVSCVWNKKLLVGVYLTSYFDFLDGT